MLSGGERNRLLLARLFARPANVLVLDEPTNDLDIESLELLEATLQEYAGTLLLVSHDRAFLDNVVTQTLAAEGDGRWREYVGGYTRLAARSDRAGARRRRGAAPAERHAARGSRAQAQAQLQGTARARCAAGRNREARARAACAQRADVRARLSPQGVDRIKAERRRAEEIERLLTVSFARWGELDAKTQQADG